MDLEPKFLGFVAAVLIVGTVVLLSILTNLDSYVRPAATTTVEDQICLDPNCLVPPATWED